MGMLLYDALVLDEVARTTGKTGNCLTLGVPTLNFSNETYNDHLKSTTQPLRSDSSRAPFTTAAEFFATLGFGQVSSLDISNYEGADIVDDLNDPSLPERVRTNFDLVYDSGTLEHIFDAPTALRSIARLVSIGGAIVHSTPANGFMDHGFWQVSPDLYRTFYAKAGFEILTSALFVFDADPYVIRADQNIYRTHGRKYITRMAPEAILVFAAIKVHEGDLGPITMQDYYAQMNVQATAIRQSRFFIPFGVPPEPEPSFAPNPIEQVPNDLVSRILSRFGRLKK